MLGEPYGTERASAKFISLSSGTALLKDWTCQLKGTTSLQSDVADTARWSPLLSTRMALFMIAQFLLPQQGSPILDALTSQITMFHIPLTAKMCIHLKMLSSQFRQSKNDCVFCSKPSVKIFIEGWHDNCRSMTVALM